MSDNNQTVKDAIEQLDKALKNLSNAIIQNTIKKNILMAYRLESIKSFSENNLLKCRDLLNLISLTLNVSIDELSNKSRKQHIVDARHIFFYMAKKILLVDVSYYELGKMINRDHATAMNSCKVSADLLESDFEFQKKINKCIEAYNNAINTK